MNKICILYGQYDSGRMFSTTINDELRNTLVHLNLIKPLISTSSHKFYHAAAGKEEAILNVLSDHIKEPIGDAMNTHFIQKDAK